MRSPLALLPPTIAVLMALVACEDSAAPEDALRGAAAGEGGAAGGGGAAGTEGTGAAGAGTGEACNPYGAATCGEGQSCLATRHDGSQGACFTSGTRPAGDSCNPQLNHTGCAPGLVCAVEPHENHAHPTCRQVCDPLADDPGCEGGQLCAAGYLIDDFTGACVPKIESQRKVAIDEPCPSGAAEGDPCAPAGGLKYRGACASSAAGLTCLPLCAGERGCPSPRQCAARLGIEGLGVCAP